MLIPFDEMFARHSIKAPGALHLGASVGQEAAAYAALGVKTVIWVEALPEVHAMLAINTAKYPNSVALQACVGDRDGHVVTFRVANNEGQSSSMLEFGTHAQEHPLVLFVKEYRCTTVTVATLLRQHNLTVGPGWFLNVDLQGAELLVLKGMGDLLWQFNYAYVEVNEQYLYKGCPLVKDIDEYLARYGFVGKETKMMKQGWGDKLYIRLA